MTYGHAARMLPRTAPPARTRGRNGPNTDEPTAESVRRLATALREVDVKLEAASLAFKRGDTRSARMLVELARSITLREIRSEGPDNGSR